jgi:TatD DNase family protein
MNLPLKGDFLDIHNHGGSHVPGIFTVENLMVHEDHLPDFRNGMTYTFGIHPWHTDANSLDDHLEKVAVYARHENVAAIGEAGFDRLHGPAKDIQTLAFEKQIKIAEETGKPVYIHCVRAWDDLLAMHKKMKPSMPWLIHGFRGKKELAAQLISRGMYISFWFDFIIRPESRDLLRTLPVDRIFLETDGSGAGIMSIYEKVSDDLGLKTEQLKNQIYSNFMNFFNI